MAAAFDPVYDIERHGVLFRSSARQVDVLLLNGPISRKLIPSVERLYEQMPDPKWVVAMGECTISGGPYYDSYSVVNGAQTLLPVDVYIPGCPVRPEAMIDGFLKLKEKIKAHKKGSIETLKGHEVPSTKGQSIAAETEIRALKKGWGTVAKEAEKASEEAGGGS
jgi:NADH-quinone oxidoreductase subunit B